GAALWRCLRLLFYNSLSPATEVTTPADPGFTPRAGGTTAPAVAAGRRDLAGCSGRTGRAIIRVAPRLPEVGRVHALALSAGSSVVGAVPRRPGPSAGRPLAVPGLRRPGRPAAAGPAPAAGPGRCAAGRAGGPPGGGHRGADHRRHAGEDDLRRARRAGPGARPAAGGPRPGGAGHRGGGARGRGQGGEELRVGPGRGGVAGNRFFLPARSAAAPGGGAGRG